jgi:hypothetical protein
MGCMTVVVTRLSFTSHLLLGDSPFYVDLELASVDIFASSNDTACEVV